MVLAPGEVQKYKPNGKPFSVSTANKDKIRNSATPCSAIGCMSRPISRCMTCLEYYCYMHVSGHQHSIDNFEILK